MIAEFGHMALILAFIISLLQAVLPMVGAQRGWHGLMQLGARAAIACFALVSVSFMALTLIFIQSDFSVKLAAANSHTDKPLLYKMTGVWGNHEGSLLLWILILALFGALAALFGRGLPATLKARALSVQAMICAGFLAFLLFTSNPFERLDIVPAQGAGLNPLLQDIGLAIHPPLLYIGYVGFSLSFSFAVAALIEGRVDAVWARWLRPWVLLAWSFLTLGIAVGSIWAYYELGWGGWWMWDPVENVSFMPWLLGTALLHSIMVLGTRHAMASWTVLLAIGTFSLSLIGTFVVRSGVLVSVHSFAVDPARGVVILGLILATTGGALTLYALRAASLKSNIPVPALSREGGLAMNNLLLIVATITVFLGTFYPLFMDATTKDKISVGKPYFDLTFTPIMCVLIVFMGAAPLMRWRGINGPALRSALIKALLGAALTGLLFVIFGKSVLGALAMGLAAYLAIATFLAFALKVTLAGSIKRLPAASVGFLIAHLGLAVFIVGATSMSVWAREDIAQVQIGEVISAGGYDFTLETVTPGQVDNYQYLSAKIGMSHNGRALGTLSSERRYYPARDMFTSEAGFKLGVNTTLFAAIADGTPQEGFVMRAYYHPFVSWIWFGAFMMALAGFISLSDRRFRQTGMAQEQQDET